MKKILFISTIALLSSLAFAQRYVSRATPTRAQCEDWKAYKVAEYEEKAERYKERAEQFKNNSFEEEDFYGKAYKRKGYGKKGDRELRWSCEEVLRKR